MYEARVEFDTRAEALDWLDIMDFRRLPVRGPVERWATNERDDDGTKLITFASSAGRDDLGNVVAFDLTSRPVKA